MTRIAVLLALLLCACAMAPVLDIGKVNGPASPAQAALQPEGARDRLVYWGGEIAKLENLPDTSEFTVIARPLRGDGRPKGETESLGRFVATRRGFLEPYDHAPGRLATVVGRVSGFRPDETGAPLPVVEVEQMRLWPRQDTARPAIGIGIGIGIGF
jgi:outer membrane lipoprotein